MPVETMIAFEAGRCVASRGRDWAAIPMDFIAFSMNLPSASAVLGFTPLDASSSIDDVLGHDWIVDTGRQDFKTKSSRIPDEILYACATPPLVTTEFR